MYQKYVDSIVESCKKDNSYVVMLKWGTIDEVYEKISKKGKLIQKIGNMVEKFQFDKTSLSFYRTGKLMISDVDHIEKFLTEILE